MAKPVRDITVKVSEPYVKIAGGYTSLRPVGLRRTYVTTLNGHEVRQQSKSEITSVIRAWAWREGFRANITFTSQESA